MVAKISFRSAQLEALSLLMGANDYLADRGFEKLRKLLSELHPQFEQHTIADAYQAGQLLNLSSPSLFAEPRLIYIQSPNKALVEDLQKFTQDPAELTFVVVRLKGAAAVNRDLAKFKSQQIDCEDLKRDSDKLSFIQAEFREFKKTIAADAQRLLTQTFANDLAELGAACSQLANSDQSEIDFETVDALFGGREQTTAFRVVDAAFAGDLQTSMRLLRNALDTGIDPVPLVATVAMKARQLAKLISNPAATASEIGMADWQLRKLKGELAGWSESSLENLVGLIASTDEKVKGGSRHPEYDLEQLLLAVSSKTS